MTTTNRPSILVIDDKEQDSQTAALGLSDKATTTLVHPQDVEIAQLENADLVLVDYQLDNWSEREAQPVSLRPTTGMALAVVLREHVDRLQKATLTAFALHTGHLENIQGRLPPATAQHVVARMNNLEWVFKKEDPHRYEQMVLLAEAIRQLPNQWPKDMDGFNPTVGQLLAMDKDAGSFERCWHDVKSCRLPADDLVERAHGILFVRWLLHQILPYPCFLWETHWVAARLQISVDALNDVLAGSGRLSDDLGSMRYSGILAGFLGDRWWRGALEDYVWELAGGGSAQGQTLRDELNKRAGKILDPIEDNPAVVCLDTELAPTGDFLSPMDAVILRPDHWPPFADSAWMDIQTLRDNPTLLPMVDPLDLHRFAGDDE